MSFHREPLCEDPSALAKGCLDDSTSLPGCNNESVAVFAPDVSGRRGRCGPETIHKAFEFKALLIVAGRLELGFFCHRCAA
jgi:hypothetical protein